MPQELIFEDSLQALIHSSCFSALAHAPGQPTLVYKTSSLPILSPPRTPSPHPIQQPPPPLAMDAQGTRPLRNAPATWEGVGLPLQRNTMPTQTPHLFPPPPPLPSHQDGMPYQAPHDPHCLEPGLQAAPHHTANNPLRSGQLAPMPPYFAPVPQPPQPSLQQPAPPGMGPAPPMHGALVGPPKKPHGMAIEAAVIALLQSRNAYDGPKSQAVEAVRAQLQQTPEVAGNPVLASPSGFHNFLLCLPCVQVSLASCHTPALLPFFGL